MRLPQSGFLRAPYLAQQRRDRGVTITVTEPTVTLHREEPVFLSPSPSQRHALALSQPRCDAAVPSC